MSDDWRVEVKGLRETQKKMEQVVKDLAAQRGSKLWSTIAKATMLVQRDARKNAPVNTGRLRASIVPEVRGVYPATVKGVVGSKVKYAAAVEFGSKPHWAPIAPLIRWVHLKKLAGTYSIRTHRRTGGKATQAAQDESVARAIRFKIAHYGTRARPYLQPAFDKNVGRIKKLIGDAVSKIVSKKP